VPFLVAGGVTAVLGAGSVAVAGIHFFASASSSAAQARAASNIQDVWWRTAEGQRSQDIGTGLLVGGLGAIAGGVALLVFGATATSSAPTVVVAPVSGGGVALVSGVLP
jgi:hypothetical protein